MKILTWNIGTSATGEGFGQTWKKDYIIKILLGTSSGNEATFPYDVIFLQEVPPFRRKGKEEGDDLCVRDIFKSLSDNYDVHSSTAYFPNGKRCGYQLVTCVKKSGKMPNVFWIDEMRVNKYSPFALVLEDRTRELPIMVNVHLSPKATFQIKRLKNLSKHKSTLVVGDYNKENPAIDLMYSLVPTPDVDSPDLKAWTFSCLYKISCLHKNQVRVLADHAMIYPAPTAPTAPTATPMYSAAEAENGYVEKHSHIPVEIVISPEDDSPEDDSPEDDSPEDDSSGNSK